MEINSLKTHSGVIRLPVSRAELIIQRTLNGLLSRTIMFDGELMRKFFNHCEAYKSLLWWHAHTREQASKHTPVFSFPFTQARTHTCKRTHTHLIHSCKGWPFLPTPPHCSVLLSSAWIRALVWAITSSTAGEGPSIPPQPPPLPSICYSIPRVKQGVEKNMPSPLQASCVIG